MSKKTTIGVITGIVGLLVVTIGLYWYMHRPKPRTKPSLIVAGVGLFVGRNQETHKFEVRKVFPNSPAEKSGIAPGLVLNKVDGVLAEKKNIKELSALLMGPVGTKVKVELMDTNGDTSVVELTREKFVNKSTQPVQ